jgi:hypothetical protein
MASTGNVFAGTGENNAGIGATAWTNPGNVTADDAADATCAAAGSSQYLVSRNFNFASIPAGALPTGITVRVEASEHSGGTEALFLQLQDSTGTLIGSSKSLTLNGTGKAVYTYGSSSDAWGATLTLAMVQSSTFGVRAWFTTTHDVRIDFVTMAVEYLVAVTGTIATTESAGDTADIAGDVIVQGSLVVAESGADTAVIAGQTTAPTLKRRRPWSHDARGYVNESQTLGTLVAATGTLAATESGDDVGAFTGYLILSGSVSAAESGADVGAFTGDVLVQGTVAAVETDLDSADINGPTVSLPTGGMYYGSSRGAIIQWRQASLQVIAASLAATETDADSAAFAGDVLVQGTLAVAETGSDTASIQTLEPSTGALDATETDLDTAAITGDVIVFGSMAATESGSDSADFRNIEVPGTGPTPAGKSKRRRKKTQVEIDGEIFTVNSKEEATQLLEAAKQEAEKVAALAVDRASKATRRPARKVLADAKKALQVPVIDADEDLRSEVDKLREEITQMFQNALQTVEIAALMRKAEIEEDDEDVLLLIS